MTRAVINRRHQATLVIMARWPRLGSGKSRLAAETSPVTAVRVQRQSLARLTHRLAHGFGRLRRVQVVIALANPADYREAARHQLFHGLALVNQHPGDLGQRMRDQLLRHGRLGHPVLVVGSDLASISPQDVKAALTKLRSSAFVLGPASDGGFWLLGWRGGTAQKLPTLDDIPWSRPNTRAETIKRLQGPNSRDQSVSLIRKAADMDDRESLMLALARRDLSRP